MSTLSRPRTATAPPPISSPSTPPPLRAPPLLPPPGDRIAAVGANLLVDDAQVIDAAGSIVMPGLIDAHHHMWLGVMRRMMPDVDDLFAYIDVVAETLGAQYRPLGHVSQHEADGGRLARRRHHHHHRRLPLVTQPRAYRRRARCARRRRHPRAAHGRRGDGQEGVGRAPAADLERLAANWNNDGGLVRVGLFGQLNLDWWKVARRLDMRILTEFIGDLAKLGPEFAEHGVLGPHNIFNHCTRVPQGTWKLFADAGVNVTVNPRSDALFGFDDESFAYQQAIDHGLKPALGIDLDTAFGSDLFGEMHALFGQQRSAMRYRRFRGEANVPAPISVEAVLEAATVNGARAAGLDGSIGTLTPGKQADVIMVRTNGVGVFPVNNAIGTIVQAVERSDVDTVMVAGAIRKRAGKLVGVDLAKLTADVTASRDYLLEASGYRPDLFQTSSAKTAA